MNWILRQIFERVAGRTNTILRVVFADRTAWQVHQGEPDVMIVYRHVTGRAPDGTVELDGVMKGKL